MISSCEFMGLTLSILYLLIVKYINMFIINAPIVQLLFCDSLSQHKNPTLVSVTCHL